MVLMSARHRLSKLLLRHGYVYDAVTPGPAGTTPWLRRIRREHLLARRVRER